MCGCVDRYIEVCGTMDMSLYNIYLIMNQMKYVYNNKINKIILNDPTKFVSDWTNECFKNNPTSEKH